MTEATTEPSQRRGTATRVSLIILVVLLLLLLCGALWVLLSLANEPQRVPVLDKLPGVKYEFSAFGGSFGRLDHPVGIAYDGKDRIYVTESTLGKVLVFDSRGRNGRVFVDTASHVIRNPAGVDVGPDGLVYVADPGQSKLFVFDTQGRKVREISTTGAAWVHVAGDRIYTLTTGTLFVTDLQGNALGQWGTFGRGPSQLAYPGGVTVDPARRMYVTDLNNYRVVALDPDFNRVWQVGETALTQKAADKRGLGGPTGITLGGDGNIYFLDGMSSNIHVVDKSGKEISKPLSGPGSADNQLYLPRSIDWMNDDLFVIADTFHNRIVGLRLNPQPVGTGTSK